MQYLIHHEHEEIIHMCIKKRNESSFDQKEKMKNSIVPMPALAMAFLTIGSFFSTETILFPIEG
jgi:hypothetical protein